MPKNKFINKKHATTYNLVYRNTDDAGDGPERTVAPNSVGLGRPDPDACPSTTGSKYPPGHPLAWLEEEQNAGPLSEERRKEMIELGFPDDGYDYLRHMRLIGRNRTAGLVEIENTKSKDDAVVETDFPAPSIFVPVSRPEAPQMDACVFDATELTLLQAAEEEEDAGMAMGGVTAFSRPRDPHNVRGVHAQELKELEALMKTFEEDEDVGDADGTGDLLDDFILGATVTSVQPAANTMETVDKEEEDETCSSTSAVESDETEDTGTVVSNDNRKVGSIASTYWREERHDRKNMLDIIDERFEHLALEYDEDEMGSLEEADHIGGHASIADFDSVLNEFLVQKKQACQQKRSALADQLEAAGFDDSDGDIAIMKAREALQESRDVKHQAGVVYMVPQTRKKEWDCESVLSMKSNLDNHPGKIEDPGRKIQLNKHGFPYLPRQRASDDGGAEEEPIVAVNVKPIIQARKKNETAEEKKARKTTVKETAKAARIAKKELKVMFAAEAEAARRRAATAPIQPSIIL